MVKTGREILRCAYPGCENELPSGEAGAAEPGYCGRPDPVTGEPHMALTAFRRRQMPARPGDGAAAPGDPDRPGFAFWRRRQLAEADAREARSAAVQADAQLAEALAAKAAAEQEAKAAKERAAQAERTAQEQVAAAQEKRDEAVTSAESRAAEAESQTRDAEQDAARAEHAEAELQRARADRDNAAGHTAQRRTRGTTSRSRHSRRR